MTSRAFEVLAELDRRYRAAARSAPAELAVEERWTGLGLRVGDLRLVVERGPLREIARIEQLARLPHAAAWLAGLVAVRGELLPLIDLERLLDRPAPAGMARRGVRQALVVEHQDMRWALAIDQALGAQTFFISTAEAAEAPLAPWCARRFRRDDETWWRLELDRLFDDPRLEQALDGPGDGPAEAASAAARPQSEPGDNR